MARTVYLNRYRIVANDEGAPIELRRHGAAVTYKAEDMHSGKEVALEVVPVATLKAAALEEIERTAEAAQQIDHINIPSLHAFRAEEEELLYVSEYFIGTPTDAWVKIHGPLPVGAVLRIALQVVSALGAAAFRSLAPRALHPGNIVLVPGQTAAGEWPLVKMLGLVGGGSSLVEAGLAPEFVSPEQLAGGKVGFESAIYSLGATLCFLLSGAVPPSGEGRRRLSGLPHSVADLLERMMEPNPDDRPRDPVVLQEQIRDCLEGLELREIAERAIVPPPAPPVAPAMERAPRQPMRWRPLAVAASVIAVAALAFAFLSARSHRDEPIGIPIGVAYPTAPPLAAPIATATPEPAQLVVSNNETPSAEAEPNPPAEGPNETSAPPSYAATQPTTERQLDANENRAPTPSPAPEETPVVQMLEVRKALPAPEVEEKPRKLARVRQRRMNGREVRAAKPVKNVRPRHILDPGEPPRFIGVAPDGSPIFDPGTAPVFGPEP